MKQYSIKNPPELPASCPPLPESFVYLGRGGDFEVPPPGWFTGVACYPDDSPAPDRWAACDDYEGTSEDAYAAPEGSEGSEIVKLNFGEPLGSWADKLPREYVDLAVAHHRAFPNMRVTLQHAKFSPLFTWDDTPEGFEFWEGVEEFIEGGRSSLPPIPVSGAAATPEKLCDLRTQFSGYVNPWSNPAQAAPKEKPLTTAEQVRRIEKRLAEQDALLASIQKLIADFNATNA